MRLKALALVMLVLAGPAMAAEAEIEILSPTVSLYSQDGVKTGALAKANFPTRVELVQQEADGRLHLILDGVHTWVLGRHVQVKGSDNRGAIICGGAQVAAMSVGGVRGNMEGCKK